MPDSHCVVAPDDPDFPAGLLALPDRPSRLWVRGRLPLGGIAVVGSRRPPPRANAFAFEFARRCGEPVVSGLALGIDAAAHRGAMAGGNPTLAYVPYGFGCTYPPENAALEDAIVRSGGGVATEIPPLGPATDDAFVARDRLQAAHARAVVLVSSEIAGGAMQTVRIAAALQKPVFAVAPPSNAQGRREWEGNQRALADGANPLPFDVDEALRRIRTP
ncbi:MAG TPA: DNA-processing protein DprA [Candidatus Acidoferrales bacterium]|nr:DNA-processing protein DprA [Candidatus Acidoferrales bacterium]